MFQEGRDGSVLYGRRRSEYRVGVVRCADRDVHPIGDPKAEDRRCGKGGGEGDGPDKE